MKTIEIDDAIADVEATMKSTRQTEAAHVVLTCSHALRLAMIDAREKGVRIDVRMSKGLTYHECYYGECEDES
jgi:hypothetical protein